MRSQNLGKEHSRTDGPAASIGSRLGWKWPRVDNSVGRAAIALLVITLLIDQVAAATLTGKAGIVDGDTIKVGNIPVRLYGIDAPE